MVRVFFRGGLQRGGWCKLEIWRPGVGVQCAD